MTHDVIRFRPPRIAQQGTSMVRDDPPRAGMSEVEDAGPVGRFRAALAGLPVWERDGGLLHRTPKVFQQMTSRPGGSTQYSQFSVSFFSDRRGLPLLKIDVVQNNAVASIREREHISIEATLPTFGTDCAVHEQAMKAYVDMLWTALRRRLCPSP